MNQETLEKLIRQFISDGVKTFRIEHKFSDLDDVEINIPFDMEFIDNFVYFRDKTVMDDGSILLMSVSLPLDAILIIREI